MFDTTLIFTTPQSALDALRVYVDENRKALLDAAQLLGGLAGLRLASGAMDGLAITGMPTRRTMRSLAKLLDLLMVGGGGGGGVFEAALFAAIDPASPAVEEICLLADSLHDLLAAAWGEWNAPPSVFVQEMVA